MTTAEARPARIAVPQARGVGAGGSTVALDIGGTKIAGALVRDDGALTVTARRPTPASTDPDVVMAAVESVVAELARHPSPAVPRPGAGAPIAATAAPPPSRTRPEPATRSHSPRTTARDRRSPPPSPPRRPSWRPTSP